jgi:hypothetical protein
MESACKFLRKSKKREILKQSRGEKGQKVKIPLVHLAIKIGVLVSLNDLLLLSRYYGIGIGQFV